MRMRHMIGYSSVWSTIALAFPRQNPFSTHRAVSFKVKATKMPNEETSALRILALHGSEGTASSLQTTLEGLLQEDHCEITTIQAPFAKGSGFAWWQLRPGERSSTAPLYPGYDESAALVTQALQQTEFDVLFGHSQGAILLVAMLANGQLPSSSSPKRIVLNGVAWPNPFSTQLLSHDEDWSSVHVLQIVGAQDSINPPEQALRVDQALQSHGCKTTLLHHPEGHAIPSKRNVWSIVSDWLAQKQLDPILFIENESHI